MDSSSLTPRLLPRAPLTGIKPDSLGLSSCEAALEKMDSEFPICKMGLIIYFSCSAVSKQSASAGLQAFSTLLSVFICSSVYLSPRSDSRRTEHADILVAETELARYLSNWKALFCQARPPEFDPLEPHGRRRESTPANRPLTSIRAGACTWTHVHK